MILTSVLVSEGHAILTSPTPRPNQVGSGIKLQPFASAKIVADAGCGGIANQDPGVQIPQVAFLPGAAVPVSWQYTIPHPLDVADTGVRIALHSGGNSFTILAGGLEGDPPSTTVPAAVPANAPANSLQST